MKQTLHFYHVEKYLETLTVTRRYDTADEAVLNAAEFYKDAVELADKHMVDNWFSKCHMESDPGRLVRHWIFTKQDAE